MEIPLTRGQTAIIDDADYGLVSQYNWYASMGHSGFYAYTRESRKTGHHIFAMHRLIAGCTFGDGKIVDHINHDTLDNRRANLRIVTNQENICNRRSANKTSWTGLLGVSFSKRTGKFVAQITRSGKNKYLGLYDTPKAASEAYSAAKQQEHV